MKQIDIEKWNRKEHFEFFSKKTNPFLGITAEVECTKAYEFCKKENISFFAYYLHKSIMVVNDTKEFKYRIIDGNVYELDVIHAAATISRADRTFAFIYVEYDPDFNIFNKRLEDEIREVQNSQGLRLNNDDIKNNIIRYTTIPWLSFTGILHPTNNDNTDSVPKISFGKFYEKYGRKYMPVSVEANHGLIDGLNIAEYFQKFEALLNK